MKAVTVRQLHLYVSSFSKNADSLNHSRDNGYDGNADIWYFILKVWSHEPLF